MSVIFLISKYGISENELCGEEFVFYKNTFVSHSSCLLPCCVQMYINYLNSFLFLFFCLPSVCINAYTDNKLIIIKYPNLAGILFTKMKHSHKDSTQTDSHMNIHEVANSRFLNKNQVSNSQCIVLPYYH